MFCVCGMLLDRKFNKRYDGSCAGYCNKRCKERHESEHKTRKRKKYGIAGSAYDSYHSGDVFKWGKKK